MNQRKKKGGWAGGEGRYVVMNKTIGFCGDSFAAKSKITQCVERLAQHSSSLAPSSSLCHGEQDCAPLLLRTRGRKQTYCQRPSTSGRCCPPTNTPRRHCACLCRFWLCSGDSSLLRFGRASTTSLLSLPFLTSLDTTLLQPER